MNDTKNTASLKTAILLGALVLIGLVPRVWSILPPYGYTHDWDWSVFGLQAYDLLHGHFRAFRYGQNYLGVFPLWIDVLFFALLGPTRLALFLGGFIYWGFYLATVFWLARAVWGVSSAGVVAVALAVFSPRISFYLVCEPSRAYLDLMILGNLMFLGVMRACSVPGRGRLLLFALGLMAGLAFWTSFLAAYFIVPVAAVMLRCRRRWFSPAALLSSAAGFFIGSFPFWSFNLSGERPFRTFDMILAGGGSHSSLAQNASSTLLKTASTLGLRFDSGPWLAALSALAALSYAALLVWLVSAWFKSRRTLRADSPPVLAFMLFAGLFGMAAFMHLFSAKYGGSPYGQRYIMPLYTVLYVAAGGLLLSLRGWRRTAGWALFAFVCAFNLWGQFFDNERIFDRKKFVARDREHRAMTAELFAALGKLGARTVCVSHGDIYGIILTFDALGRGLDFLEPIDSYQVRKSIEMDAGSEYFRLVTSGPFARHAAQMGFEFSTLSFGKRRLHYGFKQRPAGYALLDSSAFRLFEASTGRELPALTDRVIDTRWGVDDGTPGLIVEIRPPHRLGKVLYSNLLNHYPTGDRLLVETSDDARLWRPVADFGFCSGTVSYGGRLIERPFARCAEFRLDGVGAARYYRFSRPGPARWGMSELFLLEETGPAPAPLDFDRLVGLLARNGVQNVYIDEHNAAKLILREDGRRVFHEYDLDTGGTSLRGRRLDFSAKTAVVVETPFAPLARSLLGSHDLLFTEQALGNKTAFFVEADPVPAPLFWLGWGVVACRDFSVSRDLVRAVEGDPGLSFDEKLRRLRRALAFWPDNYAALAMIGRLNPREVETTPALAALSLRYEPETKKPLLFGNGLEILGYTAAPGGKLALVARAGARLTGRERFVLLGLDSSGRVLHTFSVRVCDALGGSGPVDAGQRIRFEFFLPEPSPGTDWWVALEKARGGRVKIISVDGKACGKGRALFIPAAK